jgi:hypothetical protein
MGRAKIYVVRHGNPTLEGEGLGDSHRLSLYYMVMMGKSPDEGLCMGELRASLADNGAYLLEMTRDCKNTSQEENPRRFVRVTPNVVNSVKEADEELGNLAREYARELEKWTGAEVHKFTVERSPIWSGQTG